MSKKKKISHNNNAIIGHNGYIGSFLKKKLKINYLYNSKNIKKIKNKVFDTVYLTAPSSLKYHANKFHTKDKKNILKLINILKTLKCNKIIHFSSTDTICAKKDKKNYYGINRLIIESFIKKKFKNYSIIRLPSLFGGNLKKNFFYDLINQKSLKFYNSQTKLQWYYLEDLIKDINFINKKKIKISNLVSKQISCISIAKYLNHKNLNFNNNLKIYKYNIQNNNNSVNKKYFYSKLEILKKMKKIYKKTKLEKN